MVKFNRGGVRSRGGRGGRGRGGGGGQVRDARQKIISLKRSNIEDARDMLVKMAKNVDAREKLKKIRNLREGKLDVTKTKKGAITITTTTQGKVMLTTKKKEDALNKPKVIKSKNLTRKVGRGGTISVTTKKAVTTAVRSNNRAESKRSGQPNKAQPTPRRPIKPLTRTIKGDMSVDAMLDEELLNTHVDPIIMKRTIRQSVRRQSPQERRYVPTRTLSEFDNRRRDRSRSPMDLDRNFDDFRTRRGYNDYDDPMRAEEEERLRRQHLRRDYPSSSFSSAPRTMADRLDAGMSSVSPLQGAKIIVSNLQNTVSQDDITELFGDVGPLKRTKMVDVGTAEVVFVNREDAARAVEMYHNRQLDGKAMKCQIVGSNSMSSTGFRFNSQNAASSSSDSRSLPPEIDSIHKALFNENNRRSTSSRQSRGSKPMFSMSMSRR